MLLTIDVGNTNTVLGVFRGEELIANWRLTTARNKPLMNTAYLREICLRWRDWTATRSAA